MILLVSVLAAVEKKKVAEKAGRIHQILEFWRKKMRESSSSSINDTKDVKSDYYLMFLTVTLIHAGTFEASILVNGTAL